MEGFDPKQQSQGLGDTIAKFTHATGLDVVADKVAKALGAEDCGCNRRREKLNELIPFNKKENIPLVSLPTTFVIKRNLSIQVDGELVRYNKEEKVKLNFNYQIHNLEEFISYIDEKLELNSTELSELLNDKEILYKSFQLEPDNAFSIVIPNSENVSWAISKEELFKII